MKKIFKKVVSVATVMTMITSLLFVTDTTQTNAYEGDSISLKPWSFYEGCIKVYDTYSDGSFYNSVTTSTGEKYTDWDYEISKDGDSQTWNSTDVATGFNADIKTTGFGAIYEDDKIINTPYTLRADMKDIEVTKGHDYTLYFDASWYGTCEKKYMSISINDNITNETLLKDSDSDSILVSMPNGYTQTYTQTFTVTSENNIDISLAYGPYMEFKEFGQNGTLEITNVRIVDNGLNPSYAPLPEKPTINNNPTDVILPATYNDSWTECTCNIGDDFTFDISHLESNWDGYTVKWTKWLPGQNGYIKELEGSKATYTIHNVEENDFSTQALDEQQICYNAEIYNADGQKVNERWFKLYNKAEYVNIISKDYNYALNEGDTVTFSIEAYDADGKTVDLIEEGYTINWYKGDGDIFDYNNKEIINGARGTSYTVDRIESKYLLEYYLDNEYVYCPHYAVEVCKNNKAIARKSFRMTNRKTIVKLVNDGMITASLGDKITLKPELRDADNNLIDLNDSQYSVEWAKIQDDEDYLILSTTSVNYTIDKIKDNDFTYDENKNKIGDRYYYVVIRRGAKDIAEGFYYLTMDKVTKTTEETSKQSQSTTEKPTTLSSATKITAPAQAKIAKINTKKKADKKVKLSLKKIKTAKGYQVAIYTSGKVAKNDKNAKKAFVKKYVKNIKVTLISNKLKNKKKLYVRVRAYVLDGKTKIYGKWSAVKPIKIKK